MSPSRLCPLGLLLATLVCLSYSTPALGSQAMSRASPARVVVSMLQKMEKKIEQEGEKQKDMFAKYMCYCETNIAKLTASTDDAKDRIPQLEATIKEGTSTEEQLKADLTAARSDRSEADKTVSEASAMREKEGKGFQGDKTEMMSNVAAMTKAVAALEKGMAKLFMQTATGVKVRAILASRGALMGQYQFQLVTSFLQGGAEVEQQTSGTGEIIGVLKTLKEGMEADLKELVDQENAAVSQFTELVASKTKEINTLTKVIEEKLARLGEVGVEIANAKHDVEDTSKALADDSEFLGQLQTGCKTQQNNWEAIKKMRQEELGAIADTIKIMNDDDAMGLFKKTLPKSSDDSFVQLRASSTPAHAAMMQLRNLAKSVAPHHRLQLSLILMSMQGKKKGFEKVLQMIDAMKVTLDKEQAADEAQKVFCQNELDKTEDTIKEKQTQVTNLATAMSEASESLKAIGGEMEALTEGIKSLDLAVMVSTANRKKEHQEFINEKAQNNGAVELLEMARNRLNKFYNPKQAKSLLQADSGFSVAEQGTDAVSEDLMFVEEGESTDSSTDLTDQLDGAPPPPPATMGAFKKSGQESNGVIAMLSKLISDVKVEMAKSDVEEKEAQKDYEIILTESAKKRQDDGKSLVDKESAKSEIEENLTQLRDKHSSTQTKLYEVMAYMGTLHKDCDVLLAQFNKLKEAREQEKEALTKGKSILHGADFSFAQQSLLSKRS